MEALIFVEIPQGQGQMAQYVELAPFRRPLYQLEIVGDAQQRLLLVLGVEEIQIHKVKPL